MKAYYIYNKREQKEMSHVHTINDLFAEFIQKCLFVNAFLKIFLDNIQNRDHVIAIKISIYFFKAEIFISQ